MPLGPLSKETLLASLSETLDSENLQARCVSEDWLIFNRNKFDRVTETGEPFQIFEFLINITDGKYLARVWNTTIWRGTLVTLPELSSLLSDAFHRTVPCAGIAQKALPDQVSVHELPYKRVCARDCHLSIKIAHWDERENVEPMSCVKCCNVDLAKEHEESDFWDEEEEFADFEEDFIPERRRRKRRRRRKSGGKDQSLVEPLVSIKVENENNELQEVKPETNSAEVKKESKIEEEEDEDFDFVDDNHEEEEDEEDEEDDDEEDYDEDYVREKKPRRERKPAQESSSSNKMFQCKLCPRQFDNKPALSAHERDDELKGNHHCLFCAVPFQTMHLTHAHVLEEHPERSEMQCMFCQEEIDLLQPEFFIKHYRECQIKFIVNKKLASKDGPRRRFDDCRKKCYECGKAYRDWHTLRIHYRSHKGVKDIVCPEPGCNFKTYSEHSILTHKKTHLRAKGEAKIVHFCEQCGLDFSSSPALKEHIKYVHEKQNDNVTCDQCGRFFDKERNYRRHYRKEHSGDSRFACSICGKRKFTLTEVKFCEDGHNGICKYKCPLCGKGIRTSRGMGDHMRVHSGEKPFKCAFCDYVAKSKSAIYIHERAVHKQEKEALALAKSSPATSGDQLMHPPQASSADMMQQQ